MKLKSYRELFEKIDTSSKLDERILAIGREAEKGSADFAEAADLKVAKLLPQRKKTMKGSLSRAFAAVAIHVAACALILLIVWIPLRMADAAKTNNSASTDIFEESVLSSDVTTSDESTFAATEPMDFNFFSGIVPEELAEYAFTPDFSDSDGHIVVRAEKMISDKLNTYLVLSYEYLDETGKEWMEEYFMQLDKKSQSAFLSIDPAFKEMNTRKYGVSWSQSLFTADEAGLTQYETSSKKYFMLSYNASSDRYGTVCARIEYLMTTGSSDAIIEMAEFLPKKVCQIETELLPDKCFQPMQVSISTLGLIIEGKNLGIEQAYKKRDDEKLVLDSIELVFKDDTKLVLYQYKYPYWVRITDCKTYYNCASYYTPEQTYDHIDCDIFTCCFNEPIELEEIKGIWINDVYHELN